MSTFLDHNAALPRDYLGVADQIEVKLNGEPVVVKRYSPFDEPIYLIHASLEEDRDYDLWIAVKRKHRTFSAHATHDSLEFEAKRYGNGKGQYTATVRGNRYHVIACDAVDYICLCFDPPQESPADEGVIRLSDRGIAPRPSSVQTAGIQAALDEVSANDSLHTVLVPAGVFRGGDLKLPSNCRIHLESGAVLKASDHAADMGGPDLSPRDRRAHDTLGGARRF